MKKYLNWIGEKCPFCNSIICEEGGDYICKGVCQKTFSHFDLRELSKYIISYGADGSCLDRYISDEQEAFIPACVDRIGQGCFYDDSKVRYIQIKERKHDLIIGKAAFAWTRLETINLSRYVKRIEESAFEGSLITQLNPNESEVIGAYAFANTNYMETADISKAIVVGPGCFYNSFALNNVVFGNKLAYIGEESFSFTDIRFLLFPESLVSIGRRAFSNCQCLEMVRMKEGIYIIAEGAFEGCRSLQNIRIPSSVKMLGAGSFKGCEKLYSASVPISLKEQCEEAFDEAVQIDFRVD